MSLLTLPRALTAHVARRVVRIATVSAVFGLAAVFLICYALAYFFSPWWWLLLVPFLVLFGVFLLVRLFIRFLITRLSPDRVTPEQHRALDEFTDKIERILEARSTPLPLIVLISMKDLVFHRDITTIRSVINDSVSLKRDYQVLERMFATAPSD